MSYVPEPIDTRDIVLPESLSDLIELLAKNAHDIWAERRMADGWSHGAGRDDEGKTHPELVPYEDLPDSEKQYDRAMAAGTLQAILKLGFRIERE